MSRKLLRIVTLALAVAVLAACATGGAGGRLQTAGDARVFDLALDTELDWARLKAPRQEQWTIDGAPLNQLMIISRIKPGEHVFLGAKARRSRPDGPWFRAGMRPDEVRDIVLDGLRGGGWANVRGSDLRPATWGPTPGLRFDLALDNPGGLQYRGLATAAEHDGRLTLLVWIAPAEHYYGRDAEAVSRLFDSLRFVE
ncbi:MAG TPA: hypothetical protein VFQ84_05495 [Arenimonas sp.]|uniref:hypothetical protein n=1 Tax=Arenimonas sp. TaxID=1872635 RepID=UPI002D7F01E1|nr:hypothetical protein [Arenimonas sp.]HEU0152784.1 hypothetical protein [Arenimonas sp.]